MTTAQRTIGELMRDAAEAHGERTAVVHKRAGEWSETTFSEVREVVDELSAGLIELGVAPGDRVAILCGTRPEWAYASFAITSAGGVVVPIYPTSSVEECEWVLSDSGAVAVLCGDGEQLEKVLRLRGRLPALRHVVSVVPVAGVPSLDDVRSLGRGSDPCMVSARAGGARPDDPYTLIYTSGTTGPPKGCVLSHGNFAAMLDMIRERDLLGGRDDLTYLYLPLAHALGLIVQLASFERGGAVAYSSADPSAILDELREVRPTHLPSVPRLFEKVYARLGGEGPPDETTRARVRELFGGRLRACVTGAAPIAEEILRFFRDCGIPVLEGYGMTETAAGIAISTLEEHRFGTVGRPLPLVDVRIAADGEILVRGPNVFHGYHGDADAGFGAVVDGWLHTGDLGSLDEDGYLRITGRKKDLIVTSGGKNLTPANLENDLRRVPVISQAVMHGDRRPFPVMLVTLDAEELRGWAGSHGLDDRDVAAPSRSAAVRELIAAEIERANSRYAPVERVRGFAVLDRDLSQEAGELTPTLKVKRPVVSERYADVLDALYASLTH